MENKCNACIHKSEEDRYTYHVCITCKHNPFVIIDNFKPKAKVITPQKAGELWYKNNVYFLTCEYDGNLTFVSKFSANAAFREAVHNQNGWTRIEPSVPDENVEKVVIENVAWRRSHGVIFPIADTDEEWQSLATKPRMNMTLEWRKD